MMRTAAFTLLTIISLVFLDKVQATTCTGDPRTLTERLFNDDQGKIFICKVISVKTPEIPRDHFNDNFDYGSAQVEITEVYFGSIDTTHLEIKLGSTMTVGEHYLLYAPENYPGYYYGGECERWSKPITQKPEIQHEIKLLNQFASLKGNMATGHFIFHDMDSAVLAQGHFREGKAVGRWKHYDNKGAIRAFYDLDRQLTIEYFPSGNMETKRILGEDSSTHVRYYPRVKNQPLYIQVNVPHDSGTSITVYAYYANGILHYKYFNNAFKRDGYSTTEKEGAYRANYENGQVKLSGQFLHDRVTGLWKCYGSEGELVFEYDYTIGKSSAPGIHLFE